MSRKADEADAEGGQGGSNKYTTSQYRSKRLTPMDMCFQRACYEVDNNLAPAFVPETAGEKRLEQIAAENKRDRELLAPILEKRKRGDDSYLDDLDEYLDKDYQPSEDSDDDNDDDDDDCYKYDEEELDDELEAILEDIREDSDDDDDDDDDDNDDKDDDDDEDFTIIDISDGSEDKDKVEDEDGTIINISGDSEDDDSVPNNHVPAIISLLSDDDNTGDGSRPSAAHRKSRNGGNVPAARAAANSSRSSSSGSASSAAHRKSRNGGNVPAAQAAANSSRSSSSGSASSAARRKSRNGGNVPAAQAAANSSRSSSSGGASSAAHRKSRKSRNGGNVPAAQAAANSSRRLSSGSASSAARRKSRNGSNFPAAQAAANSSRSSSSGGASSAARRKSRKSRNGGNVPAAQAAANSSRSSSSAIEWITISSRKGGFAPHNYSDTHQMNATEKEEVYDIVLKTQLSYCVNACAGQLAGFTSDRVTSLSHSSTKDLLAPFYTVKVNDAGGRGSSLSAYTILRLDCKGCPLKMKVTRDDGAIIVQHASYPAFSHGGLNHMNRPSCFSQKKGRMLLREINKAGAAVLIGNHHQSLSSRSLIMKVSAQLKSLAKYRRQQRGGDDGCVYALFNAARAVLEVRLI